MTASITQYRLETFLRGRFATDASAAHTDADEVVVIDSSVKPFRLSLTDIGTTLKLKALTAGQALDQVPVTEFPFSGNSLRPLAPANLRGFRSGNGDLFIEWDRRSRIGGGLRPNSGAPVAEEEETYLVEIFDVSTLVRSTIVRVDQASILAWEVASVNSVPGSTGTAADVSVSANGTVTVNIVSSTVGAAEYIIRSKQHVSTDFFFEVTLPSGFGTTSDLFSIGLDPYPPAATGTTLWGMDSITTNVRVDGQSTTYAAVAGDRIAMVARDGVVRYYKNYSGPTSAPLYVSNLPPIEAGTSYPITMVKTIGGSFGDNQSAEKITLFRKFPEMIYTAGMQTLDFGSTQSSVKVRVSQISAVVGRGYYIEATI